MKSKKFFVLFVKLAVFERTPSKFSSLMAP